MSKSLFCVVVMLPETFPFVDALPVFCEAVTPSVEPTAPLKAATAIPVKPEAVLYVTCGVHVPPDVTLPVAPSPP